MIEVFVFGSNLLGEHMGGSAAEAAKNHGAVWGQGVGLQGNSYAIPTLDEMFKKLPLSTIGEYIDRFLIFAATNRNMVFNIVAIGTGIAGFKPSEIAPMFADAPDNCVLPDEFRTTDTGHAHTIESLQKHCERSVKTDMTKREKELEQLIQEIHRSYNPGAEPFNIEAALESMGNADR